jgi:hypothetical protein
MLDELSIFTNHQNNYKDYQAHRRPPINHHILGNVLTYFFLKKILRGTPLKSKC